MNTIILTIIVFAIAFTMVMTGKGGGNFYVVALVMGGLAMHQAATIGQLILILTAITGMLIFNKNKLVDWKLALVIDPITDLMAFFGDISLAMFRDFISKYYLQCY